MAKKKIPTYSFNPGNGLLSNQAPNAVSLITSNIEFIKDEATEFINYKIGVDSAENDAPNAHTLITQNKDFLTAETIAWMQEQINNAGVGTTWENYNLDVDEWDGYFDELNDSLAFDLRYGGNFYTTSFSRGFWNDETPLIEGSRAPEGAAYTQYKALLINYVLPNTAYPTPLQTDEPQVANTPGESAAITKASGLLDDLIDSVANGLDNLPEFTYGYTFAEYTFNTAKCERDVGYVLDAYINDIRYTGNKETYEVASKYWIDGVPQVDGPRTPETETHTEIERIINNFILSNNAFTSRQNPVRTTQTIDLTKTAEAGTTTKITELRTLLTNVITNGTSALPTKVNGKGTVRFQGRYREEDILLITNVTKGEIIYSFNDPEKLAEVEFFKDTDNIDELEFPSFDQTADTITGLNFYYDTSTHSSTDRLQIFVEEKEMRIRPFDFGTDAIERNRVANAQSMLDADFEYGLQPTKWQAIGMQRGYPSIYEVPGTEISVVSVVTDASSGTQGIGASLITVTTVASHGFQAGDPFTIKGLGGTALGLGRAEGSFIVNTVPTSTTFTFFAKSKVGTSSGEVLSTTYTQLRKAGFYTGAAVGKPTFVVGSQGSSGTFTNPLSTGSGTDTITFTGDIPEIGAPLVDASGSIPTGAQVTAVNGDGSNPLAAADTAEDIAPGATSFDVSDPSGIQVGQGINRGDGRAVYVTGVAGNTVTVSGPLTAGILGSDVTYTDLSGNLKPTGIGVNAQFTVTRSAGAYTSVSIVTAGQDYEVNDVLTIPGNELGGIVPDNDLFIQVTGVGSSGEITSISSSGTAAPADGTFTGVLGVLQQNRGTGAVFDFDLTNNSYSVSTATINQQVAVDATASAGQGAIFTIGCDQNAYTVTIFAAGTGYAVNDVIKIEGNQVSPTQGTSSNDLEITVTQVDTGGEILNVTFSGTAPDVDATYSSLSTLSYSGASGTDGQFVITNNAGTYGVIISNPGTGYALNETFTVSGTDLDGQTPANDVTITVTGIGGTGDITSASITGTGVNAFTAGELSGANVAGNGANFTITTSGTNYQATINNAGQDYKAGDVLQVTGDNFYGAVPANDLTITVSTVGTTGNILTFAVSGTAIETTGSLYTVGDVIDVPGTSLGGDSPTNDAVITITGVGAGGSITTMSVTGTGVDGFASYTSVSYTTTGNGLNADINVQRNGTTYTPIVNDGGTNFVIGDTLSILGTALGGSTTANDLTITVAGVDGNGSITDINQSGTAANLGEANGVTGTNRSGGGAEFTVNLSSGTYTITTIDNAGAGYTANNTIVVPGNEIGGETPANDLTITINTVGASGEVLTVTPTGTGGNGTGTYSTLDSSYAPLDGNGATFDVRRTSSAYTTTVSGGGSNYRVGNTVFIPGASVGGSSGVNDVTVVITSINSTTGAITGVATTGTVPTSSQINFFGTVTFSENTTAIVAQNTSIDFEQLATIQVTFDNAHGIVPGASFIVDIATDDGTNNHALASGAYIATSVPDVNSLSYQARTAGTIDTNLGDLDGSIYLRPDSFFVHRPYDGGVQLGTGGPQHGSQAIRQSKNYIRYQSGKGIMYTTGALFAPSYDILTITSTGTAIGSVISVTTDDVDHGLQVGGQIEIIGVETAGYNGLYTVTDVVSERQFKITATSQLGSKVPVLGSGCQVSTKNWHGATVRAGAYDDQNGIFWEYDGTNLAVVQRSATFQVAGLVSIEPETNLLTGSGTRFKDQLKAGDRVVIRGMTHVVSNVSTQTELTVTPDYRGVRTATNAKMCLVTDKKVKQNNWNLDKLDGTGQSGYDVDISKMQMIGIQYSWYGAGFIDFMARGADGNFVFCHRMRNSNVNTEAFMRSGNLPVRYEVTNEGPNGKLKNNIDGTQTSIELEDASYFPSTGATLLIDAEIITYTGKSGNILTGCTRGASLTNFQAGAQRQYSGGSAASHLARTGVIIISNTITPIISHWGSAFITDGGFDSDRGYIFSYAATGVDITKGRNTALMLRLAPSVSNAITGDLGDRELLNRAQLLLNGIEITSEPNQAGDTGGIVIEGVLNPSNYPRDPNSVTWSDLSGSAQGGQPSFAQIAPGGGVQWTAGGSTVTQTLTVSGDLDTSDVYTRTNRNNNERQVPYSMDRSSFQTNGYPLDGSEVYTVNPNTLTGNANNSIVFYYNTGISGQTSYRDGNIWQVVASPNQYYNNWWRVQNGAMTTSTTMGFIYRVPTGRTNRIIVTAASFEASDIVEGTKIAETETAFPAGTAVSSITKIEHGPVAAYEIRFDQTSLASITAGQTIDFDLSEAAYALPGETIFKFIAVPGELSEINLESIKELTNTSLGGRGTFPNGPDVLAINIFKTAGNDITGNVILKWGEAQA